MMWELDDLVSNSDLADEYLVARGTVSSWAKRNPDFPAPLVTVGGRPLWSRVQVAAWVATKWNLPNETP